MVRHYLKTVVHHEEFRAISSRAAAESLTISAYIRAALARDVERQSVSEALSAIRLSLPISNKSSDEMKMEIKEIIQLIRFIASQSNPQAAARISAQFIKEKK